MEWLQEEQRRIPVDVLLTLVESMSDRVGCCYSRKRWPYEILSGKTPVFPNTFIHFPVENVVLKGANRTTACPAEEHGFPTQSDCDVRMVQTTGNSSTLPFSQNHNIKPPSNYVGATVAERFVCSRPTKTIWVQYPAGLLRILSCGNRAGRCRWSACFLGDIPFLPPFQLGAAPYSPRSPSSVLETTMLRAAQISSLTLHSNSFVLVVRFPLSHTSSRLAYRIWLSPLKEAPWDMFVTERGKEVLEVTAIDLEVGVQTTPKVVKGTGEDMLWDGTDTGRGGGADDAACYDATPLVRVSVPACYDVVGRPYFNGSPEHALTHESVMRPVGSRQHQSSRCCFRRCYLKLQSGQEHRSVPAI
ncbi:hypothetical protein PR048_023844 [Dryococelus australis]|uniref:Uncharacterized protein n=1 Tax=Dryococelus australis TaxID=614101 RepID=A0ABQ9GV87_9NEOP|nr:hypothetical protein PR048_023844 [Dryococelus australis]